MAIFAYNPESAQTWANSVINYLNGDSDSVNYCSKKFGEQIEKLVQPNVWTGAAAQKNYRNFLETQNALIKFINTFGSSFESAMKSVNKSVAELETSNLGADTNVASYGNLSYSQLASLSEENINVSEVRYDYATISSIGSVLATIEQTLESIESNLKQKIEELNSGSSIWDGDAAESAKEELLSVLNTNMPNIYDTLNICINNIKEAAENALNADTAA